MSPRSTRLHLSIASFLGAAACGAQPVPAPGPAASGVSPCDPHVTLSASWLGYAGSDARQLTDQRECALRERLHGVAR